MDVSHDFLAVRLKSLKASRVSSSKELSASSASSLFHIGGLWCGLGLGAGVGGDAGAEGRSGLGMDCCGGDDMTAFGVKGGLG